MEITKSLKRIAIVIIGISVFCLLFEPDIKTFLMLSAGSITGHLLGIWVTKKG